MVRTKLSKNGMITLPASVKKILKIKVGDEVEFKEIAGEFRISKVLKMSELINPDHYQSTVELIEEMREERKNES